jgi:hypothetical protein
MGEGSQEDTYIYNPNPPHYVYVHFDMHISIHIHSSRKWEIVPYLHDCRIDEGRWSAVGEESVRVKVTVRAKKSIGGLHCPNEAGET